MNTPLVHWIQDLKSYLAENHPPIYLTPSLETLVQSCRKPPSHQKKTPTVPTDETRSSLKAIPAKTRPETLTNPRTKPEEKTSLPTKDLSTQIEPAKKTPPQNKKPLFDELIDVKTILQTLQVELKQQVLPDDVAKKKQQAYKYTTFLAPITLISCEQHPEKQRFLYEISLAIRAHFAEAKVLSYDPSWDISSLFAKNPCQLFIVEEDPFFSCKTLLPLYQERPDRSKAYLDKTPVLFLPPIEQYFSSPGKKRDLWKTLSTKLNPRL